MKQKILIMTLACAAWGVLYALGVVSLESLIFAPVIGAAIQPNYYEASQTEHHKGGWWRIIQVDNDGANWSTADWKTNDTGSIYGSGYMNDLEVRIAQSATANIDLEGNPISWNTKIDQIDVRGVNLGTIAKYSPLSTGNAVYYADELFLSGADGVRFKLACYFKNDVANEAGTNGAFIKFVFWMGRFILTRGGFTANPDGPRTQEWEFKPMALQTKSANVRAGGQIYQRRAVASLQAIASENFETQAEVTAA